MSTSIFNVEIRLNIQKEFKKMVEVLHKEKSSTVTWDGYYFSFIEALNYHTFKYWPYRGTAINCEEYLENIGITQFELQFVMDINEELFLYYIEFIYNLCEYASYSNDIVIKSENVKAVISNIDLIVEKLNYQFVQDGDKFFLTKRSASVDSVIEKVDENIALLLLEYNDFKVRDNMKRKNEILKSIDKYIEKNQSEYSKTDKDSYSSFGYILNNFGINHKLNKKYLNISDDELLKWYDKAFDLAIHLIRFADIKKINEERKALEK